MASFDLAIPAVLEHEDPGLTGATEFDNNGAAVRYGINEAANPDMPAGFFHGMPNEDALDAAKARYRASYWAPLHLDEIADQEVATKVLDLAVNMGTGEAPLLLQRAVNASGGDVTVDGVIGPATIAAVNAASPVLVLGALRDMACQFYRDLASKRPDDARYLNGWLARARA